MKRENLVNLLVPPVAVLVAMLVGVALLAGTGSNPMLAYSALLEGSVGSTHAIARTLILATPLFLTGLSVAIAFRAGLFNIGGTGQVIMGMIVGGWVAIHFGGLPQLIHVPFELIAGAAAGAVWGAIAGWLKAVRGAHEVITTIMLNYIAIRLGEYLLRQNGLLQQHGSANPQSPPFTESAGLPILWMPDPFTPVHFGLIIALVVALGTWFLIGRTSLGYQIRAVGMNPDAAEYGGISITRITVISMAFAGAFAGLAGIVSKIGQPPPLLAKSDFAAIAIGFTGIAVALLGRNTVPGVIAAALLFGALDAGAQQVQFSGGLASGVGPKLIMVIQGLIIFFVGADALFRKYVRSTLDATLGEEAPPPTPGAPPPVTGQGGSATTAGVGA